MANKYEPIVAISDGQVAERTNIPDTYLIIEYKDDEIYITPEKIPYWYRVTTVTERCGTFALTASEEVPDNIIAEEEKNEEQKVRILPTFSLIVYKKSGWKMKFIGEYQKNGKDYILLDLAYNETYYIQHHWRGKLKEGVFNNSINPYCDKTAMVEVAAWVRETPIDCYNYYKSRPTESAVPVYTQMIYLDRGQVPNFIDTINEQI